MPFDPELKASIDRIRARTSDVTDKSAALRRKIAAREGQSGYATNVAELKAELAKEEAHGND